MASDGAFADSQSFGNHGRGQVFPVGQVNYRALLYRQLCHSFDYLAHRRWLVRRSCTTGRRWDGLPGSEVEGLVADLAPIEGSPMLGAGVGYGSIEVGEGVFDAFTAFVGGVLSAPLEHTEKCR